MERLYEISKSSLKEEQFLNNLTMKEKEILKKALENKHNFDELFVNREENETAKYLFYHIRTYKSRKLSRQFLYNNLENQGRYYLLHSDPPLNEELVEKQKLKLQTTDNSLLSFENGNGLNFEDFGETDNYLELDSFDPMGELDSMSVGLGSNMVNETTKTNTSNSLDNSNPNTNSSTNTNSHTATTSETTRQINSNNNTTTEKGYQLYGIPNYINQSELIWVNHPNQIVKQLYTALWHVFTEITNYEPHCFIFIEKVTNDFAPGYDLVVEKPMYLKKMESKLIKLKYESKLKFASDFHLMIENCRAYNNHPDSKPFLINASEMESKMNQLLLGVPNLKIEKGFLRFSQLGMNSGVFSKMTTKEIFQFEKSFKKLENNMENVKSNNLSEKIISSLIIESSGIQENEGKKRKEKENKMEARNEKNKQEKIETEKENKNENENEKEKEKIPNEEKNKKIGRLDKRKKEKIEIEIKRIIGSDRIDEKMIKIEKENRLKEQLFLAAQLSLNFEEQEAITENTQRKKYLNQGPLQFKTPLPRLFKHGVFDYKDLFINANNQQKIQNCEKKNIGNTKEIQNIEENNKSTDQNIELNINLPGNEMEIEIEDENAHENEIEIEIERGKEKKENNKSSDELLDEKKSKKYLKTDLPKKLQRELVTNCNYCEEEKEMREIWKAGVLNFLQASGYDRINSIAFLLLVDHSLSFINDFISNMNLLKERNQLNSLNIDPLTLAIQCLSSVNTGRSDLKRFSEEDTIIKKEINKDKVFEKN
ncbi:transcriptional activator spt7 [Anaeramoeba flamelloides]|uniref:Transcriptional activator spt7 n=1 Tax=Anaeramoeba flamelloides TaxID=1746091 RepID=A0ABQ8XTM6_9EUKA|nr:transcriptional activator spt7 [Anaeramoeba flamelloides]